MFKIKAPQNIPHKGLLVNSATKPIVIPAINEGIVIIINVIPATTETPFPPLNFKYIGQLWPITADVVPA